MTSIERDSYGDLAWRYSKALARFIREDRRPRLAQVLDAEIAAPNWRERIAWLVAEAPARNEGGRLIECMRELPSVWNREMPIEDLTEETRYLESLYPPPGEPTP